MFYLFVSFIYTQFKVWEKVFGIRFLSPVDYLNIIFTDFYSYVSTGVISFLPLVLVPQY